MQRTTFSSKFMIPAGIPVLLLAALPLGCKPECTNVIADDGHGNRTICGDTETGSGTTTESTTGETSSTTGMTTTVTSTTTNATTTNATTTVTTTMNTTTLSTTTEDTTSSTTAGPVCGDGTVDAGEECDDMGESSECDEDCTLAFCGDGHVNKTAGETCEVAESTAECEVATCKTPACGDGYINEPAGEECEDGNSDGGDGCSSMCKIEKRVVFVSSLSWDGDLGGLAGADDKCAGLATMAGLDGTFKAWLSDSVSGPSDRFGINPNFTGPFVLVTGDVVAEGWAELISEMLALAIGVDENKTPTVSAVWTSTKIDGTPIKMEHCNNWKSKANSDKGTYGLSDATNDQRTQAGEAPCSSPYRLYCIQVQ